MKFFEKKWSWRGLNTRPPAHKTDALPLSYKTMYADIGNRTRAKGWKVPYPNH